MFSFPNPVNEKAARVVAAGVVLISALALVSGWYWLLILLALGFIARVAAGPRISPLGRLASSVIAPRLGPPKLVPGPPKRFAQTIGATLTSIGALFVIFGGPESVAVGVLAIMVFFATLESVFGLCVGCRIFNLLMRLGVIPEDVCEECLDISRRYA
jgi:hypothetical protein